MYYYIKVRFLKTRIYFFFLKRDIIKGIYLRECFSKN